MEEESEKYLIGLRDKEENLFCVRDEEDVAKDIENDSVAESTKVY